MRNWLKITELEGQKVTLIPLTEFHKEALLKAAADGNLWELWFTFLPSVETIKPYIAKVLNDLKRELHSHLYSSIKC